MTEQVVFAFGAGAAEGDGSMRETLGIKGANLAALTLAGLSVPPGFTLSAAVCEEVNTAGVLTERVKRAVDEALETLEARTGLRLGDPMAPLICAVRAGAAVAMPGMMPAILDVGMNEEITEGLAEKTQDPLFAWDTYRRFLSGYGTAVLAIERGVFDRALSAVMSERGVHTERALGAEGLRVLCGRFRELVKETTGREIPSDPREQLAESIRAMFSGWRSARAEKYRAAHGLGGLEGVAVTVQAMVYGNRGESSGAGVCFTRNPATGVRELFGEFVSCGQGVDLEYGPRRPEAVGVLAARLPAVHEAVIALAARLERQFRDAQDIEFTVQEGELFVLQTRGAKRSGAAALRIAVDLAREGMVSHARAVKTLVEPAHIEQMLHPHFADIEAYRKGGRVLARGLAASPGAAVGRVVFSAVDAESWKGRGERVVLARAETSAEDVSGMHAAEGVLTSRGGMTSHAAVVARGWGKPCVAGCSDVVVDSRNKTVSNGKVTVREGDWISLNGTTGEVIFGRETLVGAKMSAEYETFMKWVDACRTVGVRANADTPRDARVAREHGAEGIGLCRTEHMFFDEARIGLMREMILADDDRGRRRALEGLLPFQREDFAGIFRVMNGWPVTVRLLDPPLHEFLPMELGAQDEVARALGVSPERVRARVRALRETNPMLGHRGCRLGITHPEITEMQTRALFEAGCEVSREGVKVLAEVMVPLVGTVAELAHQRAIVERVANAVMTEKGITVNYKVGTMIEVPRAALIAGELASTAEFFSFGTNDLTQMVLGYSRDDSSAFVPRYITEKIIEADPFETLDVKGVGVLVRRACEAGRATRPALGLGVCGEHAGDPRSIEFFTKVGIDYLSCVPSRVPVARLAAAQAAVSLVD